MANTLEAPAKTKRLLSLDVLRGITIAFMIMVNNNGGPGSWGFMNHAQWNGLTATDLVFPSFVFVMGASIVFAFESRLARGATRGQLSMHTAQRAVILFALGWVVNNFPFFHWQGMRFYGVLQRIAVCYLVVGLFYLFDQRVWTKVVVLFAALIGYYVLLRWVPVPGAGMPGRDFPFMDQRLNLVSWLDRLLMPHHLYLEWSGPDAHNLRDPEGLLSDLPALGTALLGLLTGLWLRAERTGAKFGRTVRQKATVLGGFSIWCLALGYLWSLWLPLNKNMWTSSYVLVAAGYSLLVLTLAYIAVEWFGWGKGRSAWLVYPWLVFGSNAIVAYIISELLPGVLDFIRIPTSSGHHTTPLAWAFNHVFAQIPDPGWAAFAFSCSYTTVCFIPVWVLYRRKIFVKV
jgi:predicted acyltransferase